MFRLRRVALRGLAVVVLVGVCIATSSCLLFRPTAVSAPPVKEFVTGAELKTLRDDYKGWIGMKITVGGAAIVVTALGRYAAPGNNRTHTVKIVRAKEGKDLASVSVSMVGAPAGAFHYADLPAPVLLEPRTSYYIVTSETFDSDQWYHSDTAIETTGAAVCDSAVYWSNINQEWTTEASKNNTFGPVGFTYK